VLLWKYSACTGRRAMYSLILFYLLIGEKSVLLWKCSACTGRRAMYSSILFLFADREKRMCYCEVWCLCKGRRAMYSSSSSGTDQSA
jgi:hypothetical protein